MSKLAKMSELIKDLKIGQPIKFKNMDAKIEAFSDEAVYLCVPEVRVDPDDFEGTAEAKRIRDREIENLKSEVYRLKEENHRLLHDPYYREDARQREEFRERQRRDSYSMMREAMYFDKPIHRLDPRAIRLDDIPRKDYYIDPLSFKKPSQQR